MSAIVQASQDPETQRRLNDVPLTRSDDERVSVERAAKQWAAGTGAPFVIADAADDRQLGPKSGLVEVGRTE